MAKRDKRRFIDQSAKYTVWFQLQHGHILVHCPRCDGKAQVCLADNGLLHLTCSACYHTAKIRRYKYLAKAKGICQNCGRWFNVRLDTFYPKVKISCPHCGQAQIAAVEKIDDIYWHHYLGGLAFYLTERYKNHTVWALNQDHLAFLIDYTRATLRQKVYYEGADGRRYILTQSQGYYLPKWFKLAKNRAGILKVLERMQKR